ncbi:hypothetical protein JZU46_07090 [bacterium]|nr:hypothetical protein [bacterium]
MSLLGWENSERIQFTIDTLNKVVDLVPFAFKLNADTGLSHFNNAYVFDKLTTGTNSLANRKKVIFSQLIDGEEIALCCELDSWDHLGRRALFWVKPKKYYTDNINIFYFYFDKLKSDNTLYLSETNAPPVTLYRNYNTCGYDSTHTAVFDILKIDNIYKMWLMGHNGSKWQILYCSSTDLITWTTPVLCFSGNHTYDTGNMDSGSVIYDSGIYKMWYSGHDGSYWRIMYCTSIDGLTWSNFQMVVNRALCIESLSQNGAFCCSVIKLSNVYRMWYCGALSKNNTIYCESSDGINWGARHQLAINCTQIHATAVSEFRPSKVIFKNNLYMMWAEVYYSSTWQLYYCESVNGIIWTNFKRFVNFNLEGIYDTSGTVYFNLLEEGENIYHMFYSGSDGTHWRILYSRSSSLTTPATPAQSIWADDFFSVHHFNPSYGYKDSTNSRLNIVSTNSVLGSTSNLGNASLLMQSYDSYINFGNSASYSFTSNTSMIVFGKFNSGNIIVNKDFYRGCSISLIHYGNESFSFNTSESFTGPNYSQPSVLSWERTSHSSTSPSYIFNNKLFMSVTAVSGNYNCYSSNFALVGDFDIQIDFSDLVVTGMTSYSSAGPEFVLWTIDGNSSSYLKAEFYNPPNVIYFISGSNLNGSDQSYTRVTRYNNYGSFRYVRIGSSLERYYRDGLGAWTHLRTTTFSTSPLIVGIAQYCPVTLSNNYDNFIINSGTLQDTRGPILNNSFCFTLGRDVNTPANLNLPGNLDNTWITYTLQKDTAYGANSTLIIPSLPVRSINVDTLYTNGSNLLIGATNGAINGELSEAWFANKVFTPTTLAFIDSVLKDTALLISKYYIQGYITEYNKAIVKKVVVYSSVDNQLLGMAYPSPTDGYYYCEVPYLVECIILALDGEKYNHNILGKVLPKQL